DEARLKGKVKKMIRDIVEERLEVDQILARVENALKEWMENTSRQYWTHVDVTRLVNDAILQQLLETVRTESNHLSADEKRELIKRKDRKGWTALHWAVTGGRVDVIKVLLSYFSEDEAREL